MRLFIYLVGFLTLISCSSSTIEKSDQYKSGFEQILSNYDLKGVILVLDPQTNTYYSNDFELGDKRKLPASTFKIPNAMIALESNVLVSDTSVIKWDGKERAFDTWEKDLTLRDAFQVSCVPCFQEIARKIGVERMQTYLGKLHYNNMEVNKNTIDNFWLQGASQISAFEQIDFLKRFYTKQLPILTSTYNTMLKVFKIEENNNYILSGKTGWSDTNNGWFVGFIEKQNKVYYIAVNVDPLDPNNMSKFKDGRKAVAMDAFHLLKLL